MNAKVFSARFIAMVLVMATLCAAVLVVIGKCFVSPESYEKLKEPVLLLLGSFGGAVSMIITAYFNRADRGSETSGLPAPDAGSGTIAKMLVVALVAGMVGLGVHGAVYADDSSADAPKAWFEVGSFSGWLPLQRTDITPSWRSITTGDDFLGAQCNFITWPNAPVRVLGVTIPENIGSVSYGAVTSFKANGMPYASASVNLLTLIADGPNILSFIGAGYGIDFKEHKEHFLVGTVIPLNQINISSLLSLIGIHK